MPQILTQNGNPFRSLLATHDMPAPAAGLQGVVWNPEFTGLLDFDVAAVSAVCDFKESDNYTDPSWTNAFGTLTDNPEVFLYARAIECIVLEQSALDHADPEDVYEAFEGLFVEHQLPDQTGSMRWRIQGGTHFYAAPVGLIDSDQAIETRAYRYPTSGVYVFPDGPRMFDLDNDRVARIAASATATGSLLGANASIRVRVHGVAVRHNYPGARDVYDELTHMDCGSAKNLDRIADAFAKERVASIQRAALVQRT